MELDATKPVTARDGTGLGSNVIRSPAIDFRAFTPLHFAHQERHLTCRYGLSANYARLIAEIAFAGDRQ